MIKGKFLRVTGSLKLKFLFVLLIGLCAATAIFFGIRSGFNYYIENSYLTKDSRLEREEDYLEDLQSFIDANYNEKNPDQLSETKLFSKWSKSQKYVYLMVYKDDQLFYSSDMEDGEEKKEEVDGTAPDGSGEADAGGEKAPEKEEDTTPSAPSGGFIGSYPTYEELKEYAAKNGTKLITLGENGAVQVSIAEFTEYLYYDLSNITGLVAAILLFSFFMLFFFTRIMVRVTRLAADVNRVSAGELNYSISAKGSDEISRLSRNVENMRSTIIENLEREREAREANTELITSMSHDIRTPLTVLLGYLDVIKQNSPDEKTVEYVRASELTAMRLKRLSDDMFNYFLVFGNELAAESEEYNAYTLLAQMLDEHVLLLSESGYRVDISDIDCLSDFTVRTDAPKLMRIIDNIFSNFYKYADPEEPIGITVSQRGGTIELEFVNRIKQDGGEVESNRIGLKSCAKLATVLGLGFVCSTEDERYLTRITFPDKILKNKKELQ